MRTIIFFDLPNVYTNDKRNYTKFRRFLINEGFIMMQESVYSKLMMNSQQIQLLIQRIKRNAPKKGIIQVLNITENQYAQIEYIIGSNNTKILDNEERLVIIWKLKFLL